MVFRPIVPVLINLALALIPVALAFLIARGVRRQKRATGRIQWLLWGPLVLVWLAFLPNTCYLLTEWRHYLATVTSTQVYTLARHNADAILDLLLLTGFYMAYSGVGLLAFFLAIWPLDRLVRPRLGGFAWAGQALFFVLCSLGVYLGLIPRYNTKDLLHMDKVGKIVETALHTMAHPLLVGLILGFGAMLWLLYLLFDIWMDGAAWRLRRRPGRHAGPGVACD